MVKKTEKCGNISGGQLFLFLLITSLTTATVQGAVTGIVDVNVVYQQLEGFGGAAVYDCPKLVAHTKKEEIYDLLFKELGIDILRIRNTYDYSSGTGDLTATGTIVAAAKEPQRNPNLKIELVPWSPASYLKSTGKESNGTTRPATLAKSGGLFVYDAYATWWANSLTAWANVGVYPDYISIQNEPDIETDYDSCKFTPTETTTYAGYDQAFEHVFQEMYSRMGSGIPKMLAPCTMGFGGSVPYITALIDQDHVYGFSHHLYTDGSYDDPDGMISGMTTYGNNYGYKTLHMTEYVRLSTTPDFNMAWRFAWHIYNCLYYEGVSSFYNWTLFRGYSTTSGGIVTMTTSSDYVIRPQYWFLKAYTHFTDPGWYVVHTSVGGTGASNLRMSAFKNPDSNQLTVVILNITDSNTDLTLTLNGFSPTSSEVYRSSATENWAYQGTYSSSVTAPAKSITTIHLTGTSSPVFSNCAAVQAAGYGLTSDISGDCYVNYRDLEIIADYWLSDCSWLNNYCDRADFKLRDNDVDFFDFSKFAVQWMQCNNPNDPGCEHNW
jgi:glucuronoarabinoxylan endo-1,4-beta-xylanase